MNNDKKRIALPSWMDDSAKNIELLRGTTVTANRITHELLLPDEEIFLVAHKMNLNVPTHQHDYYELVFVDDGQVRNTIDTETQFLLPGSLLIMNLHSQHALSIIDPNATIINLCLRPSLFHTGIFQQFLDADNMISHFLCGQSDRSCLYFPFPQNSRLRVYLNDILRAYWEHDFHQNFTLAALVLLLLDTLTHEQNYSYHGIDQRCLAILDYIQQNLSDVSLTKLADHFNFNPSHLSRYIHQHIGTTTSELIIHARLDYACQQLMADNSTTIEDIARSTGWRSLSHFYRIFRQHFGLTPEQFRYQQL